MDSKSYGTDLAVATEESLNNIQKQSIISHESQLSEIPNEFPLRRPSTSAGLVYSTYYSFQDSNTNHMASPHAALSHIRRPSGLSLAQHLVQIPEHSEPNQKKPTTNKF